MSVQYLTDEHGERVSVLLSVEEYKRLLETEEQLEDILARSAYDRAVEELERGEDEVIPLEQAIREIREGKVPEE
jgi:PHD/YefM family antitoxin component YafN of YafNO toxin-antitoxin module